MRGFFSALQFLSRIPVPPGNYRLEESVVWLPVVGLLLGAILAGVDWALRLVGMDQLVGSTVVVVLLLVLSGALHADGLMDTCDAVFGHATPARRLEIMRDPRAGAFGVVGLVCVVALKIAAIDSLETLPAAVRAQALVLTPGLGRWSIALVSTLFPYGRPIGLGAPLKVAASPRALLIASVLPVGACVVTWPIGPVLGPLSAVTAVLVGRWLMTLLPGLTGDCYGAICEVVETVVLLVASPLAHAVG